MQDHELPQFKLRGRDDAYEPAADINTTDTPTFAVSEGKSVAL